MVRARPAQVMCWNSKRTQQSRVRGSSGQQDRKVFGMRLSPGLRETGLRSSHMLVSTHHQLQHLPWLPWTPHVRHKAREVLARLEEVREGGYGFRLTCGRLCLRAHLVFWPQSRERHSPSSGLRGPGTDSPRGVRKDSSMSLAPTQSMAQCTLVKQD